MFAACHALLLYGKAVQAVLAANAPKFTGVVPADAEELLEQLIRLRHPARGAAET